MHSRAVNATRLTFAMLEIGCSPHAIFSAYLAFFWNITVCIGFATTSLRFFLSMRAFANLDWHRVFCSLRCDFCFLLLGPAYGLLWIQLLVDWHFY